MSSSSTSVASSSGYEYSANTLDLIQNPDFDFLMQGDHSGTTSVPYTNLGFEGGQHDFDDGSPAMPDLFGGFFFGGPQGDGTLGFAPQGMEGLQFGDGDGSVWVQGQEVDTGGR